MQARRFDSLDAVPACYDSAFAAAERRSIFLSRPWLENLQRTMVRPGDRTPVFAVGADGGGVLPCWKPGPAHPGVAAGLQGLSSYYASLYGPVLEWPSPGASRAIEALVAGLAASPEAGHRVRLAPLPADDGQLDALEAAFRRQGWWTRRYFCFGNWYLPCDGMDYASYLAARPSALRNTLRRKQRRFEGLNGARLELIRGCDDVERGLSAFQQVYARSWKQPEPYPEFIPGLVRTLARQGWLRLGIAWVGDRPAAAQIWALCHGVASIYKLAYDPEYTDVSAGSLLSAMLLCHALDEERVQEVDYLTGDDRYKRDWMSHRRERWGLVAFDPRTVRGLVEGAGNLMSMWGKQMWRTVRTPDRDNR